MIQSSQCPWEHDGLSPYPTLYCTTQRRLSLHNLLTHCQTCPRAHRHTKTHRQFLAVMVQNNARGGQKVGQRSRAAVYGTASQCKRQQYSPWFKSRLNHILATIGSPIGRRTIGPVSSGFGRGRPSL